MTANGLSSYELFVKTGETYAFVAMDIVIFCKKSLSQFYIILGPLLMILCFCLCMASGYYFFKITTPNFLHLWTPNFLHLWTPNFLYPWTPNFLYLWTPNFLYLGNPGNQVGESGWPDPGESAGATGSTRP